MGIEEFHAAMLMLGGYVAADRVLVGTDERLPLQFNFPADKLSVFIYYRTLQGTPQAAMAVVNSAALPACRRSLEDAYHEVVRRLCD